ncbi:MAG: C25 family cysteine peptidase, partial [candidate division Zixibacteria bacterium]|nr:C25 family cysteine peptidase [candidate division Zixibacteria bacterium]
MRVKGISLSKAILVFVALWFAFGSSALWAGSGPKWIQLKPGEEKTPQINVMESNLDRIEFEVRVLGMRSEELQTKGGVFNQLSLPEYGITNVIGEPELPVIRKMVQIPYGATVNVEVIASEVSERSLSELGITDRIIPVQPPIPKIEGAWEKAEFVIHEDFYQTDQFFPTQVVKKGEIGIIRGHRFVMVEVFPVSYNPVSGRLRIYSDIKIKVNLVGSDRSTTESMLARYASPPFEELCKDLFINYSAYEDLLKGLPPLPIGYLIIVHNDFQSQVAPLAEWKTKKGYHVTVANTTQTGTTTTSIKNYITQAY